ncbi:class I SAM-dependent methyltransferase [Candidatus Pacearchaeota archaeon]|nr:class I SAM-dependent methyltransferase [Candidatus Pacearchaeota archaeon]
MNLTKQYEDIGKDYISGQKEFFSDKEDRAMTFILNNLPDLKNKIILDVGCGNGNNILKYNNLGAKKVFGIDSSKVMVDEAKKIVKEPDNIFIGNMNKLPFKDKFFDIIIGKHSIHYLENLDEAYIEFARVLKKGGILILIAHHPIFGYMQLGAKDYLKKDAVEMKLYEKVKIKFFHHTFKEYFSDALFKSFRIEYFDEHKPSGKKYSNEWNVPTYMEFKAVRK